MKHAICLAAILAATPALAGPYAFVQGGIVDWPATSNHDEIEADSKKGGSLAVGGGWRLDLNDRVSLGIEGKLGASANGIHGYNPDGHKNSADHMDGNTLVATSLMLNARPAFHLYGPVSVYALAGAGGAHLSALDDTAITPAWQIGGGLEVDVIDWLDAPVSVAAGVRHFQAMETDLAGANADFRTLGAQLRVTYSFTLGE